MSHEKGEDEMENKDTHATNTIFMTFVWAMRVCDTHEKCEVCTECMCTSKTCVRQVSVCTHSVAHTVAATTCVRNSSKNCRKISCREKTTFITPWPSWQSLQFVVWVRWVYVQHTLEKFQTASFHVRHALVDELSGKWNDAYVTAWASCLRILQFFSYTACPCKFSSGQLQLSDGIGSKFHVYKLLSGSRSLLETSELLCPLVLRSVPSGAFETWVVLRTIVSSIFFDNFCNEFFQRRDWYMMMAQTMSAKIRFCVADK